MAATEKDGAAGEYRGILPIVGNDTVRLRVKDGDEVICEIDGIGRLTNKVRSLTPDAEIAVRTPRDAV